MPDEQPEWLEVTPEMNYYLEAWGSESDSPEQKIPLDFDEYTWLKQTLAIKRGYTPLESDPPADS